MESFSALEIVQVLGFRVLGFGLGLRSFENFGLFRVF